MKKIFSFCANVLVKMQKIMVLPAYGANGANKIDLTKWLSTPQPYAARFDSLICQRPHFLVVVVKFKSFSSLYKTLSKSASLNCN